MQAARLSPRSVSGTTKPVPFNAWVMAFRGYDVTTIAMDVWEIDDSKFVSSGFSDRTMFAVTYAGVVQITFPTEKCFLFEKLIVKGPEPEMLSTLAS